MSFLSKVTKGKFAKPDVMLVHGPDGIGKSTLAAGAPDPLFTGDEDGTADLDVARMPRPENYKEYLAQLDELRKVKHDYRTLVTDSADWLEPLIWEQLCKDNKWKSIESPGYGKGFTMAQETWRTLIKDYLQPLVEEKKMNVVIIAHSMIRTFHDPQQNAAYDRYILKMNEKSASILREWVDTVLFANYQVFTQETERDKAKAVGTGKRVLYTERRPAFDAKNRAGLPFELEMSWADYSKARDEARTVSPDKTRMQILKLLEDERIDDKLKARVTADVEAAGNLQEALDMIVEKLKTKLGV